jgi:hypothetical protein
MSPLENPDDTHSRRVYPAVRRGWITPTLVLLVGVVVVVLGMSLAMVAGSLQQSGGGLRLVAWLALAGFVGYEARRATHGIQNLNRRSLVISPDGLEYHHEGGINYASWSEVAYVGWVFTNPRKTAKRLSIVLQPTDRMPVIPIDQFLTAEEKENLLQAPLIHHLLDYAPHALEPESRIPNV